MHDSRRRLLTSMASVAGLAFAGPALLQALQQPRVTPQPMPSPNAPTNPNFPQGLDGPPLTKDESQKRIEQENQKTIRLEVQQLYELVSELKDDVEKTDANTTLSVTFVKKAQTIEKLAKTIKNRAKH